MLVVLATTGTGAQAATVTVGSPLSGPFTGTYGCGVVRCTMANTYLADPSAYVTSPVTGTIVQWRLLAGYNGGPFWLRVLRPAGGGAYVGAGTSDPVTPPGGTKTFPANLPVQAGDLIAVDLAPGGALAWKTGIMGSQIATWDPALADNGGGAPTHLQNSGEVGYNADVQPATASVPTAGPTGERAAALKKCKKKHSKRTRRKCRRRALQLPL